MDMSMMNCFICPMKMMKKISLALATLLIAILLIPSLADQSVVTISGQVKDIDALISEYKVKPWVTQIDMYGTKLKPEQLDKIKSELPNVSIGCQVWLVEKHYVRTDATAYALNHNNRAKKHKSSDFNALKYCQNLMALDLSHNQIDDLEFLKGLPKLRVLLLGDNRIEDISALADLHDLEYLELFKNKIKDVTPLMDLDNLIDLNLSHNYIDDLFPLAKLSNLMRLWIYNSNNYSAKDPIPKEAVAELEEAMYGTYIDSTSYSTLGGWREHPRYFVVFNMFHGRLEWLPWDAEGLVPRYK
jgi:hypothetical protein